MNLISCILFFILITFANPAFAQFFTINTFHSDITVNKDSSFVVTEIIQVEFHKPRHGIYREIPFKYGDDFGRTVKTPIEVLSVTDGTERDLTYRVRKSGNVINIRIGDPKKYVDSRQTYIVSYKVGNAIMFFEDHDELYWNVTGNYWKAPIKEASADVSLKINDKSTHIWAACYTGVYGSKRSDCTFKISESRSEFFTKKNLNIGEGLTIAFG